MRYCGIDVSARAGQQQLVTLHERRGADGLELVATFYAPGSTEQVARTIEGFGRGEAVVGVEAPASRSDRMRACDARLFRRGLPLYPIPREGHPSAAWDAWIRTGLGVFAALDHLGRYVPQSAADAQEGPVGSAALHHGRVFETYPDAIFCTLLGHRPAPKRTPWGLQQRITALRHKGVIDEDGGLWHRTLDELDACAAAYTAYALAAGHGTWVGDPAEAVIVLPAGELLGRYDRLPPPSRVPLVG